MYQNAFIIGATGNVGTELIDQIVSTDTRLAGHENPTRIIGLASSSHFVVNPSGLEFAMNSVQENVRNALSAEDIRAFISNGGNAYSNHADFLQAIKDAGLNGEVVFVDVTANEGMTEFQKRAILESPNKLVTANKKPLAGSMETFKDLTRYPGRYRYSAAVMAGGVAVTYLQQAHLLSEELLSIRATLSGTGAFICSELEKGWKFSEIVKRAKELKYTEPHPGEDLGGKDVMRKLLILVRSAWVAVSEEDVKLSGFVDMDKYDGLDPEAFLEAIQVEDADFESRIKQERERWNVPRYIAEYVSKGNGAYELRVGLQYISQEDEMARGIGTANKIMIHTSKRSPLSGPPEMSSCAWAGVPKTAAAVRANLWDLLRWANLWEHKPY